MVYPRSLVWGRVEPRLESLFGADLSLQSSNTQQFTTFIVRLENRGTVLEILSLSPIPIVKELMRFRAFTNTVVFPSSQSASGQALDTALSISGLMLEGGHFTPALRDTLGALISEANRGGNSQRLEQALLDLLSLGQRLNWGQLVAFVGQIEDTETLRLLAHQARLADGDLPLLFSAVLLSNNPAAVAKYLMDFSQTGLKDLGASLRFGSAGLNDLLRRNQRLYAPPLRQFVTRYDPFGSFYNFVLDYCRLMPWLALPFKWICYLGAGFLLAAAFHFAKSVSALEQPLQVRGVHFAREFLFALGFLLVVLLLSEPFLSQESQKVEFPFRLRLPMMSSVVPAGMTPAHSSLMNQANLLTMLLFFVLQGLLYTACVVKLAEIRRQKVPPRMKLKLLDNEDHLFDAGLYLGFLGTIISFILFSLHAVHQFSLMVAYSSTSFGIIFVSFFKIFHLRPVRRRLLLEAEAAPAGPKAPTAASTFATLP